MKWLAIFAIGATALAALGCGDDDDNGTATASTAGAQKTGAGAAEGGDASSAATAARAARPGKAIKVVDSDYGRVKLQVTYKGHPLYYYVDDSPGTILCQDVFEYGGLWLVVKPNGNPVT